MLVATVTDTEGLSVSKSAAKNNKQTISTFLNHREISELM